ncbi:hypothetical protein ACLOJK_015258 [Asimina triloba]
MLGSSSAPHLRSFPFRCRDRVPHRQAATSLSQAGRQGRQAGSVISFAGQAANNAILSSLPQFPTSRSPLRPSPSPSPSAFPASRLLRSSSLSSIPPSPSDLTQWCRLPFAPFLI